MILLNLFVSGQYKSSASTWQNYKHLFEKHSTPITTPKYLAALAQVESAGNPVIIPEWKWRLTTDPFRIYAPASTSAGLYQYTKPTFKDAKRFCIHSHEVALDGPILNPNSCWFNMFYSRLWPSHAIEMTSARLTHYVGAILKNTNSADTSLRNKQKLASIIHLCGVGKGRQFARSGFRLDGLKKCGSHSTEAYLDRIFRTMKKFR